MNPLVLPRLLRFRTHFELTLGDLEELRATPGLPDPLCAYVEKMLSGFYVWKAVTDQSVGDVRRAP